MSKTFKDVFGLELEDYCLKQLKVLMTDFEWSSKIAKLIQPEKMFAGQYDHIEPLFDSWRDYAKDGINPNPKDVLKTALMEIGDDCKIDKQLCTDAFNKMVELEVTGQEASVIKDFIVYEALFVRLVKIRNRIDAFIEFDLDVTKPESFKEMFKYGEILELMSGSFYKDLDNCVTIKKILIGNACNVPADYE